MKIGSSRENRVTRRNRLRSLIAIIVFISAGHPLRAAAAAPPSGEGAPLRDIAVHAAEPGRPSAPLQDGVELPTLYDGPSDLALSLQRRSARPLALGSGDFDEDGVADLIVGYAAPLSGGILAVHRGNADAIYPNAPEAKEREKAGRSTESAFLRRASAFGLPEMPALIATGDFNADGHLDIVAAERGRNTISFLSGDGRGGFGSIEAVQLPGRVTALVGGEINRRDGLADLAVAIAGQDGPRVLIFESPHGALRGQPESLALSGEATALALGYLDGDVFGDLAIAAGSTLVVVRGRDRKLSLDSASRDSVPKARIEHRTFPFSISAIATGEFTGHPRADIALLRTDGRVEILEQAEGSTASSSARSSSPLLLWNARQLPAEENAEGEPSTISALLAAHISTAPGEDLVLLDRTGRRIRILGSGTMAGIASLEAYGEPLAVLPMRLNGDAFSDLVVLANGHGAPAVTMTAPAASFTVTNVNDSGTGSLRDAITLANLSPGFDSIRFSIGTGPQTISLTTALPTIMEAITIDGTTQPGFAGSPIIVLREIGGAAGISGLRIEASGCTVRGLVIQGFTDNGLIITGPSASFATVERCFIGTTRAGIAAFPNNDDGIEISNGGRHATIGGTTTAARNVISGNLGDGVFIDGAGASNLNTIQLNYIGTNTTGTAAIPNGNMGGGFTFHGFELANGTTLNTINGNVVSGNAGVGVGIFNPGTSGNLVLGNALGVNATGTVAIPNGFHGAMIRSGALDNTIGGTVVVSENVISGNVLDGVWITDAGTKGNIVQGNFIGTNVAGTIAIPNGASGGFHGVELAFGAQENTIGGTAGAGNLISGNGSAGVGIFNPGTTGNFVQGNLLGPSIYGNQAIAPPDRETPRVEGEVSPAVIRGHFHDVYESINVPANRLSRMTDANPAGLFSIGNVVAGVTLASGASNNTIGGTDPSARNIISGNPYDGVLITGVGTNGNTVQGNFIGTDPSGTSALPNGRGMEIAFGAANNTIGGMTAGTRNIISGNQSDGILIANAGTSGNRIQGNLIGTAANGISPLGNASDGVILSFSQSGTNTIGGTLPGAGNRIAFNGGPGLLADSRTAIVISGNSIDANAGLGIDLLPAGVTPNDHCDGDGGPNGLQNRPVLNSAVTGGGNTAIQGSLDSVPNTTFTLEFFATPSCDPSGSGEGAVFLGSEDVTTDGSCMTTFTVMLPGSISSGQIVTATAIDPAGNTSEFSECTPICALPTEVTHLEAQSDKETFSWDAVSGSSPSYDLLRGVVEELPVGNGASEVCVEPATSDTSATDSLMPATGGSLWYLVRARNVCGAGSYGQTSGGAPRVSNACP